MASKKSLTTPEILQIKKLSDSLYKNLPLVRNKKTHLTGKVIGPIKSGIVPYDISVGTLEVYNFAPAEELLLIEPGVLARRAESFMSTKDNLAIPTGVVKKVDEFSITVIFPNNNIVTDRVNNFQFKEKNRLRSKHAWV